MFGWLRRKNGAENKEDVSMAETTKEEIKKAEDDIAEKGEDTQTERDRVDESVAAQERKDGTEDTQTAKDRVDESESESESESDSDADEPKQDPDEHFRGMIAEALAPLHSELAALREELSRLGREPKPADDSTASKLAALERRFTE